MKVCLLVVLLVCLNRSEALTKRASFAYKDGEVNVISDKGKDIVLQPGQGGRVRINGPVSMNGGLLKLKLSTSNERCTKANKGVAVYKDGGLEICDGVRFVAMNAKLGSVKNPAPSCKAILDDDWSAPSGVYYIRTDPSITKVYCYMEDIPGCGKGGWTTIMKTNGYLPTFNYYSALWTNKKTYHMKGGQSGADHQETKLPTYWSMPFTSLCLGLRTMFQSKPNWIRVNYRANSLYSVIADNRYRKFSVGRNKWKNMIPGSSLQKNCNREGFNSNPVTSKLYNRVRIGIVSNNENDCKSPDSRIGFGGAGTGCGVKSDNSVSTGNVGRSGCGADAGNKAIKTNGYILAQ